MSSLQSFVYTDGCVAPTTMRPAQFLKQRPYGAYTAALVKPSNSVIDWQLHLERLTRSVQLLHEASHECYAALLHDGHSMAHDRIANMSNDAATRVLRAVQQSTSQQDSEKWMLTVVIEPESRHHGASSTAATASAHLAQLPPLPSSPRLLQAAVLGPPRTIPEAKWSRWVVDREPITTRQLPDDDEALLCCDDGGLLEGCLTSLFIAQRTCNGGTEVRTAPAQRVLPGIMRLRVLQACNAARIHVVESSPHPRDSHLWCEAFLTSSVRTIAPLRRIVYRGGMSCTAAPYDIVFNGAPGEITQELLQILPQVQSSYRFDL